MAKNGKIDIDPSNKIHVSKGAKYHKHLKKYETLPSFKYNNVKKITGRD